VHRSIRDHVDLSGVGQTPSPESATADQFTMAPANLTTLAHFSTSLAMSIPKSSIAAPDHGGRARLGGIRFKLTYHKVISSQMCCVFKPYR